MNLQRNRILALLAVCVAAVSTTMAVVPLDAAQKSARDIYERAREQFARVDSYVARLTRREVVQGERRPEEVILFKFRARPWSAYMKWVGDAGEGREGIYVKGQHQNKVQTRLAAGDIPLVPAGRRMALDPDGTLMRAASPHPITELGIGAAVERIGAVLAAQEKGDDALGTLHVIGPERHEAFAAPAFGLEHRVPAGVDAVLPSGGRRLYWFDPVTGLPLVMQTRDRTGGEVESYRYDRLQLSVDLDDEDFDPDHLWGVQPQTRPAPALGTEKK